MNKIIMLKGLPAAGKTTLAKRMIEEEPGRYVRISKEDLRKSMFFGDIENCEKGGITYWRGANAKFGKIVVSSVAKHALSMGYDVIVDGSNLSGDHERFWRDVARNRCKFELVELDTPYEECLKRNRERDNPVPEENMVLLGERLKDGKQD